MQGESSGQTCLSIAEPRQLGVRSTPKGTGRRSHRCQQEKGRRLPPKPSVATGGLHTGMTEASGKDSAGVPKGQMTVAQFLEMTADDRKVVR